LEHCRENVLIIAEVVTIMWTFEMGNLTGPVSLERMMKAKVAMFVWTINDSLRELETFNVGFAQTNVE